MRIERDEALLELARAREQVEALRLALPAVGRAPPPNYPASQPPGPPPLRYRLVDAANDALKRYFEPLHRAGKRVADALKGRDGD